MVEPCCAERQLPAMLKEQKGQAMVVTNGDVTMMHFFRSLSYMAGPTNEVVLAVGVMDVQMCRWIRQWMQRGWTTRVTITTRQDQREMISAEMEGWTERVTMATDEQLQTEMMAFRGERGTVTVSGRMLSKMEPGVTSYFIVKGENDLLRAIESRHRLHLLPNHIGDGSSVTASPSRMEPSPAAPTKKTKTKTKKAK